MSRLRKERQRNTTIDPKFNLASQPGRPQTEVSVAYSRRGIQGSSISFRVTVFDFALMTWLHQFSQPPPFEVE